MPWKIRLGAWLIAVLVVPPLPAAPDSVALEYKVKAGYLFNFAKFIEWPSTSLPAPDSPFVIGVLDGAEAVQVWQPLFAGKSVNGHPVQVRSVHLGALGPDVHILFVTRGASRTPEEIRAALGDANTLLVGESDQFAERGGMVGFVREDDVIRLTLNLERATRAGLKVSAKLSSVAKVVKTLPSP